jgi:hypothetical protein
MFSLVPIRKPEAKILGPGYFVRLNAGGRMHEPDLLPAGMLQKQLMLQAICLLQMPPQKTVEPGVFRNWRAETVPAQRTAVTMVAKNIFLPMSRLLYLKPGMITGR